ncbi:MAG: sigma-54 dependent transcriptional regulator [Luteolibacter sp.]|uniref:sigma-54-dependent transcriptional regulator n=1 Tax=Luteolibacter sp. TaxID=1962973 RepID=UPI003267E53C
MNARILIADDTPASLSLLSNLLEPLGHEILAVSDGRSAINLVHRAKPDLVLLDVMMPGNDGFSVCRALKADPETADIPVIFITSRQETGDIVRGFRLGAVDYILKPFHAEEVVTRVTTHLKLSRVTRELRQRNTELEEEIFRRQEAEQARDKAAARLTKIAADEAKRWGVGGFVGSSAHLKRMLDDIRKLHQFGKTSVLITGESGTGKELVARAIHHQSPRATGPFIPVNCVAIPGELAESLFFGHMKGAFTGATSDRKGFLELADGGTLFLDEIGDMPSTLQGKLLRVLEDGEVTPVGSNKPRQVDVRVVSATNADLPDKMAAGDFRQDLFFRLARFTVETPPLRERREDIPLLSAHFLDVFATEMGMAAPSVLPEALEVLRSYPFPGNIRELKNVMERALILSGGKPVSAHHLQLFQSHTPPAQTTVRATVSTEPLPLNLDAAEQELIQRALETTGGNVAEAARLLGVNRSRIYRRFPQEKP